MYINRFITGIICVRKCQQILNDAIWRMDCQSIWQRFAENLQESRELCPSLIIDSLAPSNQRVFLFLVETSFLVLPAIGVILNCQNCSFQC